MAALCRGVDGDAAVILEYIRAQAFCLHAERLTLRGTSQALGLSESTIQRALNTACGISFHEALERIRVERALVYLVNEPRFKIEALALYAGWSGRANLYAAIRRVTGYSLAEFRKDSSRLRKALARGALTRPDRAPDRYAGSRDTTRDKIRGIS